MPYGAFVNVLPGKDGMVHVSELEEGRVENVEDVVKMGDEVTVMVIDVEPGTGKISLSRRAIITGETAEQRRAGGGGGPRAGGGGGGAGGPRRDDRGPRRDDRPRDDRPRDDRPREGGNGGAAGGPRREAPRDDSTRDRRGGGFNRD